MSWLCEIGLHKRQLRESHLSPPRHWTQDWVYFECPRCAWRSEVFYRKGGIAGKGGPARKPAWLKYVNILEGWTAYEWQIGPLYGRFTKLRYWWRCPAWKPFHVVVHPGESIYDETRHVTFWKDAVFVGWDKDWHEKWDEVVPEVPQ